MITFRTQFHITLGITLPELAIKRKLADRIIPTEIAFARRFLCFKILLRQLYFFLQMFSLPNSKECIFFQLLVKTHFYFAFFLRNGMNSFAKF